MGFPRRVLLTLAALIIAASFAFAICGDGAINAGEQCDGNNLNGMTCEKLDQGYLSGSVGCNPDCTINISSCSHVPSPASTGDKDNPKDNSGQCGEGLVRLGNECVKRGAQQAGSPGGGIVPVLNTDSGIINDERFPAINFFGAISLNYSFAPLALAIASMVWAALMIFAASVLRTKRSEEERKEVLSYVKRK